MKPQQESESLPVKTELSPVQQPPMYTIVPYSHSSGYAIASLVLGIISSVLACMPILPTLCSILGILFVIKARKRDPLFKNGLVTAGLILSILRSDSFLALSGILDLVYLDFFAGCGTASGSTSPYAEISWKTSGILLVFLIYKIT